MNKIKKAYRKLKRFISQKKYNIMYYYRCYEKLKLDDNAILLCAQQGKNIDGNIFYILKELQKDKYKNYKIYVAVDKAHEKEFDKKFINYNFTNYELVNITSKKYFKILASAKYLFNDTSFLWYFVKKEGQVYFNTWHGTPFKTLGKSIKDDFHLIGNVQRNFLMSDYLLYPSEFMRDVMLDDYMINNIAADTKVVLGGYPRNEIFFDKERASELKNQLNLNDKQIIAYMPTWRGSFGQLNKTSEDQINIINKQLKQIDKKLTKNQIMYVNFHPFLKDKVNISGYKHIKPFDKKYETYDFLNIADVLITDYSSVFFDFAVSNKKIILFAYDEKEYFEGRGTYFGFNELPFKKVKNVHDLIDTINSKDDVDITKFLNRFCPYENINASSKIVELVLNNKKGNLNIANVPNNKKKNVLIYSGNLAKNGITGSLFALLNYVDLSKYNFYITYVASSVRTNKNAIKELDSRIGYISFNNNSIGTFKETLCLALFKMHLISYKLSKKILKKYFERKIKINYGNSKFDSAIQYSGYGDNIIRMFASMNCKTSIFVHSDMTQEIKVRKNQNYAVLSNCYNEYKNVFIVSDKLYEPTRLIAGENANIICLNNIINKESIVEKSLKEVIFDENTESNISLGKLNKILNSKNKKIISIGRFSKEKGYKRLIQAFDTLDTNSYLIIIGGFGPEYDSLLVLQQKCKSKDRIIIIKSMSNPFSILRKCDVMVVSSFYEGLPMVILEAIALNIPVASTDIESIKNFFNKFGGGYIMGNSYEGICEGLKYIESNQVERINIDVDKYNKEIIDKFYKEL
ncbi:putative glycosyl/glycerophosphate transferases involved in teichoic acid biosynthesis TagF/TagB/EpsJ/RodC [Clostridium sp. CAG:1000]|nr:putative glycosyl/glycerophosphate transferases involved in teichoic acid biosynthesis TagF/TagB/EpsJ/RodC [Clostridium sp. CAG:1000]